MLTSTQSRCTICGQTTGKLQRYGGRSYCGTHLAEFATDNPTVWRVSIIIFGLMITQIGLLSALELLLDNVSGGAIRALVAVVTTLLPALAWFLLLFIIGARKGIQFSPLIPVAAVVAALAASAAINPFLNQFLNVDSWLASTTATNRLIGNVLLYGFTHVFVLYAIVRYLLWSTPAFSRRVDGILFSIAVMWGYATTLNIIFVADHDGLSILNGGLRLLSNVCAFQAAGIVVGYFVGMGRFEDKPAYYLTAGISAGAILNGLLLYTGSALNIIALNVAQDGFSPWPGMIASMLALAGSFAAVYGLVKRSNTQTLIRLESTL